MDPGIENPKTRPDPNFHCPTQPEFSLPGQYPKPDMLPEGTRHFLMIIIKILKSQEITLFVAFSAKWALFLAPKNFSQNFFSKKKVNKIFHSWKFLNCGAFD